MGDDERSEALLQKIWERVEGLPLLDHRVTRLEQDNESLDATVNGTDGLAIQVDRLRNSVDLLLLRPSHDITRKHLAGTGAVGFLGAVVIEIARLYFKGEF